MADDNTANADVHSERYAASQIEGLLGDDGHFNPSGEPSRQAGEQVDRSQKQTLRDNSGRFVKESKEPPVETSADDETDLIPSLEEEAGDEVDNTEAPERSEGNDEAPSDEEGTGDIRTAAELAEALEIPIEELFENLTHTFRAADEDMTVTLAELQKGYQKDADYRRSTAKLADDRRAMEQEVANRAIAYEQQSQMAGQQIHAAMNVLMQEANSQSMQALRESDPAEWGARQKEFEQRAAVIGNIRQQAAAEYENFRQHNRAGMRERGEAALKKAIPDFGKSHVDTATEVMKSLSYGDQEIAEIFDPRTILGALELATLRAKVGTLEAEKAQGVKAAQKVKEEVPKLTKPGKPRSQGRIPKDNVSKLRAKARKSGNLVDAAKVIENLL